jgi:NADH-quinone oxidoreductase subunit L
MLLAVILLLPLAGYLLLTLAGKYLSKNWSGILASFVIGLSFVLGGIAFLSGKALTTGPFTWIDAGRFSVTFSLQADALSMVMLLMITGVSTLIHIYSIGYMKDDPGVNRFFASMNLFVFFMLLLVTADNYLLLFAGWEGVGLCSYLLIGFWFKNPEYSKAADKAFIMNRIGDLGFILGLALLYHTFGTLSFAGIAQQLAAGTGTGQMTLVTLLLFAGATGKSAQIPLFTWLPDAMAGPTPVSALIHAATMVTAGIYLVIRSKAMFLLAPVTMQVILVTGIFTSLLAAAIALKQNDIKKILAYSTVSQLGLMFFALGLGAFDAALFHLLTHAFFKALLFLGAGSVIHSLHGEQDIRRMGGLRPGIRITFFTMLTGALAISGIPPLSGFFSKDAILLAAWHQYNTFWILAMLVSMMTAFYMFRMIALVFYGQYRGEQEKWKHLHESPRVMTLPLIALAVLSIIGGMLNLPALFGGHEWLSGFTGLTPVETHLRPVTEILLMGITLAAMAGMIILAFRKYSQPAADEKQSRMGQWQAAKFYVDEIYQVLIVRPADVISNKLYSWVEVRVVDAFIEGIGTTVDRLSRVLRYLQSGSVSFYLFFMVVGVILVIVFNLFM